LHKKRNGRCQKTTVRIGEGIRERPCLDIRKVMPRRASERMTGNTSLFKTEGFLLRAKVQYQKKYLIDFRWIKSKNCLNQPEA